MFNPELKTIKNHSIGKKSPTLSGIICRSNFDVKQIANLYSSIKQQKAFLPALLWMCIFMLNGNILFTEIYHSSSTEEAADKRINREKPFLVPCYLFLPRTFTNRLLRAFESNSLHFFCSLKVIVELCRVRGQQWDY